MQGVIRDFAGPYYVSEDNMAFGNPTRLVQYLLPDLHTYLLYLGYFGISSSYMMVSEYVVGLLSSYCIGVLFIANHLYSTQAF